MLFALQVFVGITWGLPSRSIDSYLFLDGDVWTGEKIHRLAGAAGKFDSARGADVDVDPMKASDGEPILLNGSDEDVAKILLRYRLYTHQPDEMITMMSLAGMRPGRLELDPKLYQYGGLFIYPVGALIKLCGMLGLIDVRSDVTFYLDNPDEFGKFYIVARLYSALWGMIGVVVVYSIARRIASDPTRYVGEGANAECGMRNAECGEAKQMPNDFPHASPPMPHPLIAHRVGLLAALLYSVMPVVVCMSHEGKPHLPGAVLMLIAVRLAIQFVDTNTLRWFWWTCVACGAAVGMVLSSWPICVLIPLLCFRAMGASPLSKLAKAMAGSALSIAVYIAANPYVLINAFTNREVLRSNFGNSLAMYEVARLGDGLTRVLELTVEGATPPVMVLGALGLALCMRTTRVAYPLLMVAVMFFLQFVLIGAGKPAEYGRFGIFTNTALAIGCACSLTAIRIGSVRSVAAMAVVAWTALGGVGYLNNFRIDATPNNSRTEMANLVTGHSKGPLSIVIPRDPAPYNCPPMDFRSRRIFRHFGPCPDELVGMPPFWSISTLDVAKSILMGPVVNCKGCHTATGHAWWDTPISWANKPIDKYPCGEPIGR